MAEEKMAEDRPTPKSRFATIFLTFLGVFIAGLQLWIGFMQQDTAETQAKFSRLFGESQVVSGWLPLIVDKKSAVRVAAVVEMGRIRTTATVAPLLIALNDEKVFVREAAARALADFEDRAYLTRVTTYMGTHAAGETKDAGDIVMRSASQKEQKEIPKASVAEKPVDAKIRDKFGWAYLGHFDGSIWRTRYFDFSGEPQPKTFEGKVLRVAKEKGALNIREGMPTPEGTFPRVKAALRSGSEVSVEKTANWEDTGYWWAKISYRTN